MASKDYRAFCDAMHIVMGNYDNMPAAIKRRTMQLLKDAEILWRQHHESQYMKWCRAISLDLGEEYPPEEL